MPPQLHPTWLGPGLCQELSLVLNVGGKRMLASEELLPASEGGKPASF